MANRLSRGAATRQPGCLEPVTQVAEERCAVVGRTASLCLGLIRAPTRAIPIMPDLTGPGGVAGTPMHSVDSVRTVFQRSRSIFQLRTTHAP